MKTPRPYWHVDAKWVFGIICFFILSGLLFNLAAWRLTSEKVAVPLLGKTIAYMYSRNGLDDQGEIEKFRQKIAASPTGKLQPIPTMNIYVSQSDLNGKTPRELRYWIFEQVAAPIYNQEGVDKPMSKFGVLAFVSKSTNQTFMWTMIGQAIMLVAFGIFFVYFSSGFGRLFGPGLILFLTSVVNTAFWGISSILSKSFHLSTIPLLGSDSGAMAQQLSKAAQFIVPDITRVFFMTYAWALGAGIVLMISAGVGKLIFGPRLAKTQAANDPADKK